MIRHLVKRFSYLNVWRGVGREYAAELDERQGWEVRYLVSTVNWSRIRVFLILTIAIQALLIVGVDVPAIRVALAGHLPAVSIPAAPQAANPLGSGEPLWLPLSFLALHGLTLVVAAIGVAAAFAIVRRNDQVTPLLNAAPPSGDQTPVRSIASGELRAAVRRQESLAVLIAGICLTCMGAIAGLDQLRSGDIGAYTMNVVVVSIVTLVRWPLNLALFGVPYLAMAAGVVIFQADQTMQITHLVNSSVFFCAVTLLSTFLYNNQYSQIAKSRLLERANRRLDHLSFHDQLTDLPNRRAFESLFQREVARSRREGGSAYLAVLDLDLFKHVNDIYGHPAGDAVLCTVARVLERSTRDTDIVARWGGEEFLVFLNGGSGQTAIEVADRIRRGIEQQPTIWKVDELRTTVSVGLTTVRCDEEDPLSVAYHRADSALYEAKRTGRNRVCSVGVSIDSVAGL